MFIKNSLLEKVERSMNMSKNIIKFFLILFVVLMVGSKLNVNAVSTSTVNCGSYSTKKTCEAVYKCRWMGGVCYTQNVADEPCNDVNIRKVLKIFGYVLMIAKILIPLIIIGYGTFDLYKAVVDKDDKSLQKQVKRLIKRVIAGILIFFVPNFVHAILGLSDYIDIIDSSDYMTCADCLLDPTDNSLCSIKE